MPVIESRFLPASVISPHLMDTQMLNNKIDNPSLRIVVCLIRLVEMRMYVFKF